MSPKVRLLIVLWPLAASQTRAQDSYKQRLQVVHKQMATAYLHHDTAALLRIYAVNAVAMPEYHPALFGKKAIAA
jgi:ketosteroid isomerase-like protein